ncbi:MAG: translation initiation factor IF-2 [Mycoplasmoidaceae bacterium]
MNKKPKYNKKKHDQRINIEIKQTLKQVDSGINKEGIFIFSNLLTPDQLAKKLGKSTQDIIKFFFMKGKVININTQLSEEQMGEYTLECGFDFKWEESIDEENFLEEIINKSNETNNLERPPIVTIMGHVDHGKTTLLDKIRKVNSIDSEAGGITQKIGAYNIVFKNKPITFLDTPGHEAFSQMRSRGVNVTDIVILVVAADDGVKLQTLESLDHARSANSPIIVFINKMDKPGVNPDRVISQLAEHNLVPEEWGGENIFIKGSALKEDKITDLLSSILVLAEMLELKCSNQTLANGVVIESNIDKGLGPVANILVRNGILMKGDFIVAGSYYGKVKKMINQAGKDITEAGASIPLSISGLNGAPAAGEKFIVTKNEKTAKHLIEKRTPTKNLFDISQLISEEDKDKKILKLILKSEMDGSLQALKNILSKIDVEGTKLVIIRAAVGPITESDVSLAKASKAVIYGFNIEPSTIVSDFARSEDVFIKNHDVIFHLKEEIEELLKGKLDPIYEEEIIGHAEVRQLWVHSDVGTIAGCRVLDGKIQRSGYARVLRDNNVIVEKRRISSLKTGKEQINEIDHGKDCGITIDHFNDIIENDIIEVFKLVRKK